MAHRMMFQKRKVIQNIEKNEQTFPIKSGEMANSHRKCCLVIGREVIAVAAIYRCGDTAPRVGESVHRVGESVHRAGDKCPIN